MSVKCKVIIQGRDPLPSEHEFLVVPSVGDTVKVGRGYAYRVTEVQHGGIAEGDDKREMSIAIVITRKDDEKAS